MSLGETGCSRRVPIEPAPERVVAELKDDYHRMAVALEHAAGVVRRGSSEITSVAMDDFVTRGDTPLNRTHPYDLSLFGAVHADESQPTTYDIVVTDAVCGRRNAWLWRDGASVLGWRPAARARPVSRAAGTGRHADAGAREWIAGRTKPQSRPGAFCAGPQLSLWAVQSTFLPVLSLGISERRSPNISAGNRAGIDAHSRHRRRFSRSSLEPMADHAAGFG